MICNSFRELTTNERALILKLLEPVFPGRDELFLQIETAKARTIDENGSLEFLISSDVSLDRVKYGIPVEGEYEDTDGITVHLLLHVLSDKVKELEVFREDNTNVLEIADVNKVRVFAPE